MLVTPPIVHHGGRVRPVLMPPNRLAHFYLGGQAITELRHVPAPAERSPEEWLASTATRHGEARTGLSTLPDGTLLRDAVAADPDGWTGGVLPGGPGDVGVLVKLLDAGQRLPVHVHPDRGFAGRRLHSCYGKTEAWYVLGAAAGAAVHVGFTVDVTAAELARAVAEQDERWMLDRLHRLEVAPGDVVLVPAGTPHAIGAGIFVVEVQEPTDFSILLEHIGFAEPADAFLGLDPDEAVGAVTLRATGPDELAALRRHVPVTERGDAPLPLLPPLADEFFRAHLLAPAGDPVGVEPGFAVLVVLGGQGRLEVDGSSVPVGSGDVVAVPHGAGDWALSGDAVAVLCRPA